MKLSIGAIAAAMAAATPGFAADDAGDAARLRIADAFDRAQLTQDRAGMERMIADDLVFIEGNGQRSGKTAFIAGWMGEGDRYDPIVLEDRIVTPLGADAFMVTARTVLTGTSDGKRFASAFRFTDTFRRIGGAWKAVHIQVTRTAPSAR